MTEEGKERKKAESESITFRIEKMVVNQMRQETEQKRVSLNTLANQIFKDYVDWHSHAGDAGLLSFPKTFMVMCLDKLPDEEITKLAEPIAKKELKDVVLLLRKNYDIWSLLDAIESWLRISGFAYRREVNDTIHSYVLQHEMGKKWSLFLGKMFEVAFMELASCKTEFEVTDNMLVFKVDAGEKHGGDEEPS